MMAARVSSLSKCEMCEAYIDTRHSPKTTDNSTTFLNSNINPESKPTKCEICININIKANRIYLDKLKESTESKRSNTQNRIKTRNQKRNFLQRNKEWIFAILLGLLFGSVIHFFVWNFSYDNSNNPAITATTLKSTLERLSYQFPSLKKSFLKKVNGAFLRLKTPGEPFIFLLLHDDSNKKSTDCLASYTSYIAKKNIFTKTVKSLWMDASEWIQYSNSSDKDLLHHKLIEPLEENEVLVVENLQDLPWMLATSFHHLCDAINPQISKAMYLLELRVDVDRLEELSDGDKMVVAEQAMNMAWMDAPNSFRAALIARLTSYVDAVLLKSDEECPNSAVQPLQPDRTFIKVSP